MSKIILASLLAFTAPPLLADPPVAVTSSVETADLDLSSATGQRTLDLRLAHAVREVCGEASTSDIAGKNQVRRCRTETLASVTVERDQRVTEASREPIEVASR